MDYLNLYGAAMNPLPVSLLSARTGGDKRTEEAKLWARVYTDPFRRLLILVKSRLATFLGEDIKRLFEREWFKEDFKAEFEHLTWWIMAHKAIALSEPRRSGVTARTNPLFTEELKDLNISAEVERRLPVSWCVLFFTLSGLVGWGWATYAMGIKAGQSIRPSKIFPPESAATSGERVLVMIILWLFTGVAWFIAFRLYLRVVVNISQLALFVLTGLSHTKFIERHGNPVLTGRLTLGGIHIALRYRKSQQPHDRSFALAGILSSLGTSLPQPNYDTPLWETYQLLMENLIAWDPSNMAMLVDAGRQMVEAVKTTLSGLIGANPYVLIPPWMEALVDWFRSMQPSAVPPLLKLFCQTPQSYTYAVLRGIKPVEGPTKFRAVEYEGGYAGDGENPPTLGLEHVVWKPLPLWKGPYDFEGEKSHFMTFMKVYDGIIQPMLASQAEKVDTEGSDFTAAEFVADAVYYSLRNAPGSYSLLSRLANRITRESRCPFTLSTGLLGSGPLDMEIGDEVYLLQEIPTPMALRRSDEGTFRFIGAALVHGLMHKHPSLKHAEKDLTEVPLV
ncbi:hypothetical protein OQA88_10252 [Cercophora sp. LCS_1]